MFIPLAEVPSKIMGGGEERHYFLFHERNKDLPVEVVITRLPPYYEAGKNWHRHDYVQEFSVPLTGEILIKEKRAGEIAKRRHLSEAILKDGEWVVGISCDSAREVEIFIDSPSGNRHQARIKFDPKYTEGKELHTVENPTDETITMVTMKRVPKSVFKKSPLVFRIDRIPVLDER
ncbi:MAG: hypothetical protein UU23_C0007G0009 [Candidatus Curtissbacteria bacterium GW2011_GWA1_40_9]|uniref:Uncharacterized protein n=1 Tax=Candidatus Curtissbacteria bacterium GW2011_GWA1_40_9 TaxID=1618408 RepID=A0A0G0TSX9_9BACT|nr:MAG: hypothetical protein UU23_C0007G0009 [Candidatus Curtissbacteria bacterium GW2011_GWA1_40_9]